MNGYVFGETGDICLLDLRIVKIVEVIEDGDLLSRCEQAFNEMGADETGSACDQDSHGAKLVRERRAPNPNIKHERNSRHQTKRPPSMIITPLHVGGWIQRLQYRGMLEIAPVHQQINPV